MGYDLRETTAKDEGSRLGPASQRRTAPECTARLYRDACGGMRVCHPGQGEANNTKHLACSASHWVPMVKIFSPIVTVIFCLIWHTGEKAPGLWLSQRPSENRALSCVHLKGIVIAGAVVDPFNIFFDDFLAIRKQGTDLTLAALLDPVGIFWLFHRPSFYPIWLVPGKRPILPEMNLGHLG